MALGTTHSLRRAPHRRPHTVVTPARCPDPEAPEPGSEEGVPDQRPGLIWEGSVPGEASRVILRLAPLPGSGSSFRAGPPAAVHPPLTAPECQLAGGRGEGWSPDIIKPGTLGRRAGLRRLAESSLPPAPPRPARRRHAHPQAGDRPPRRERLEPGEPLLRLVRRRPEREGRGGGQAGGPGHQGGRPGVRHLLHVRAEARHPHPLDHPGRRGPDVGARGADLAPQRAPLRGPHRAQQGRDGCQARRGAGQDLEALLRRPAAPHGRAAPLLRRHQQGAALRQPEARGDAHLREPQGHHCPGSALLERADRSPDQGGEEGAHRCPRQQLARYRQAPGR
ncbi:phosphoglycerate mutase 2 isoform X1 [Antechinus flavipes]|uniref:phosphoglycerate mutase 2 isoform X1 n=1 Tax=Antechinus flavipes TaxID=38775 RepID=UPI0022358CBA|nr:phosphoglycerate mutase 2 isoform X1 [Antechinus flavipes]